MIEEDNVATNECGALPLTTETAAEFRKHRTEARGAVRDNRRKSGDGNIQATAGVQHILKGTN